MATEQTKEIIEGSLRTLAQFVPVVGGAAAQAWSEYAIFQRSARIDAFFCEFRTRLEALENKAHILKAQIEAMTDFARLLEDTVDAVRRETDEHKRRVYPQFFLNLIFQSRAIPPEERSFLVETLDSLTKQDLDVLSRFQQKGWSRGDILTRTIEGRWAPMGVRSPFDAEYEGLLAPAMISTAKLEARGIILPVLNHYGFEFSGTGVEWYDNYRRRAWKLMPVGRHLLDLLSPSAPEAA